MPRDGAGIASWPANGDAIPNSIIDSGKYNTRWADLLSMLNTATPISAGGTNATTAVEGADNLSTIGANIASATTTDLSTASGVGVTITGAATITGFGTEQAGALRHLTFSGAATLTHNATSLILPGAANIVTAAGDTALAQSLGGGNWRIRAYQRASGQPLPITALSVKDSLSVTSTDAGATVGPIAQLIRDSASPAASDLLATLQWIGRDSAANLQTYADIYAQITDPTTATEDAVLFFETVVAGAIAARLAIGAGLYTPGATGGDKGVNTLNVSVVYQDGVRVNASPDAVLEDQKATGTDGGTFTSGAWRTRDLNTEVRDPSSLISISANQFTPTVNGWVEWTAPAYQVNRHQTRLYNVTDAAVVAVGSSAATGSSDFSATISVGGGAVVAGKTYRIEHQCATTNSGGGLGLAGGFAGTTEVYTHVKFWRTA